MILLLMIKRDKFEDINVNKSHQRDDEIVTNNFKPVMQIKTSNEQR